MDRAEREAPFDLLPEYEDADLGDERRSARLLKVAAAAARHPGVSLRASAESDAALEGTYRLLNNPAVTADDIFTPHQRQTCLRAGEHNSVLVLHDTTSFTFKGDSRTGLGRMHKQGGKPGFYLHTTLAVAEDTLRTPLGIVHFEANARTEAPPAKRSHREYRDDPFHEGRRWLRGVVEAERQLSPHTQCVHVMDREGDSYEHLWKIADAGSRYVIRMATDRSTTTPVAGSSAHVSVRTTVASVPFTLEREVKLYRRVQGPSPKQTNPPREQRLARLALRAHTVELHRPASAGPDAPKALRVGVVQVQELTPPEGQPAVEWTLLTNLPVDDGGDMARVVDIYRARWLIEEYFKALKTGCAIEKREHESYEALLNVVALFLPIAWRLLALRTLAASESPRPASQALTPTQLEVIYALLPGQLPESPSVADAMWATAALGGHRNRRKRPGWIVLGRGFEKLLLAEEVWLAARRSEHAEM